MRFTQATIASLTIPPGKTELIIFDEELPRFGIRLRSGGKRTWIVQYRIGRKHRRLSLGPVEAMKLATARDEARRALAKVGLAMDPQAEKERARSEASVSLGGVADSYLAAAKDRLRPRSYIELERHLRQAWAPLRGQPINGIDRATVASHLSSMTTARGPVAANAARTALSALYSWAMREGIAEANPVALTNRPAVPRARDRVLRDDELRSIWRACRDDDYGRIIRLLILTGQRRDEVASMAWSEIDLEQVLWSLPGSRTKNHRPHDVPFSDLALEILASVPRRAGRDLLFGESERGFSGWSKAKLALDKRIAADREGSGLPALAPWRLHDLRRTFATRGGDLGLFPHVIEAVLNHVSGSRAGVAGIYNRSLYAPEKRDGMVRWSEHLRAVVTDRPSRVIQMRREAG